jgi:hypothetical protein
VIFALASACTGELTLEPLAGLEATESFLTASIHSSVLAMVPMTFLD